MENSRIDFGMLRTGFFVLALAALIGCNEQPNSIAPSDGSAVHETCTVEIEFNGKSASKTIGLACPADSTVISILSEASNQGKIELEVSGSGETSFVKSIDGIANEGYSGDNWVYRVNGKLADRSAGVFAVSANDEIQWSFGEYSLADKQGDE